MLMLECTTLPTGDYSLWSTLQLPTCLKSLSLLFPPDINRNEEKDGKFTAMLAAANADSPVMIQALVDAGADLKNSNGPGWTSLFLAKEAKKEQAVTKLKELGSESQNTQSIAPFCFVKCVSL
jgi:ankyrin repeat protein